MLDVFYAPSFVRQFSSLDHDIQEEILEKIELFKDKENHKQLKVHKLKGRLSDRYSFSVDYRMRIIFSYFSKNEVRFLALGDHDMYK